MIEPELGAMVKRIAQMVEDRCSDYAVGAAVLELAKLAMEAVIENMGGLLNMPLSQADQDYLAANVPTEGNFGRLLTPAERMDLESGIVDGMEWSPEDTRTFVDALADPPAPSEHLWQAADRYGRR